MEGRIVRNARSKIVFEIRGLMDVIVLLK